MACRRVWEVRCRRFRQILHRRRIRFRRKPERCSAEAADDSTAFQWERRTVRHSAALRCTGIRPAEEPPAAPAEPPAEPSVPGEPAAPPGAAHSPAAVLSDTYPVPWAEPVCQYDFRRSPPSFFHSSFTAWEKLSLMPILFSFLFQPLFCRIHANGPVNCTGIVSLFILSNLYPSLTSTWSTSPRTSTVFGVEAESCISTTER